MAHKTRKTKMTWRWQLDVLLILLIISIFLWIMTKIDLLDMDRVMQAYLPPIAEPQGVLMPTPTTTKRNWLETEILPPEIITVEQSPDNSDVSTNEDTANQTEETPTTTQIPSTATTPVRPTQPPRPAQVAEQKPPAKPATNDKVSLTPTDELF